ncbi:MAG: hypothetical protein LBF54_02025 [Holosporaceae bacterium]|jgi:hypothetical protein|nr:hypothetical protein [Holosporaceae bacterium]
MKKILPCITCAVIGVLSCKILEVDAMNIDFCDCTNARSLAERFGDGAQQLAEKALGHRLATVHVEDYTPFIDHAQRQTIAFFVPGTQMSEVFDLMFNKDKRPKEAYKEAYDAFYITFDVDCDIRSEENKQNNLCGLMVKFHDLFRDDVGYAGISGGYGPEGKLGGYGPEDGTVHCYMSGPCEEHIKVFNDQGDQMGQVDYAEEQSIHQNESCKGPAPIPPGATRYMLSPDHSAHFPRNIDRTRNYIVLSKIFLKGKKYAAINVQFALKDFGSMWPEPYLHSDWQWVVDTLTAIANR